VWVGGGGGGGRGGGYFRRWVDGWCRTLLEESEMGGLRC